MSACFLNNPAARDGDEVGGGLHQGQAPGVNEADSLGCAGGADGEVVADLHEVVEAVQAPDLLGAGRLGGRVEVHPDDPHSEAGPAPGDLAADIAEAHDSERGVTQLQHVGRVIAAGPHFGLLVSGELAQLPGEGEDHGEAVVGNRVAVGTATVGEDNVALDQFRDLGNPVNAGATGVDPAELAAGEDVRVRGPADRGVGVHDFAQLVFLRGGAGKRDARMALP